MHQEPGKTGVLHTPYEQTVPLTPSVAVVHRSPSQSTQTAAPKANELSLSRQS
jgi:hypothetical protein